MDRVRFLEEDPSLQRDVRRLVEEAQRDPSSRSKCHSMLREELGEDLALDEGEIDEKDLEAWSVRMYSASVADRIDELIETNTELWIEGERERVFSEVLRCGHPLVLALPHDPFTHEPLLYSSEAFTPTLQLHLEPGSEDVTLEVLFDSVDNLRTGVGVEDVELVGYSASLLEELERELKSKGSEDGVVAATMGWSWEREDGSRKMIIATE